VGSLKDDELVVMGIYPHESQDMVSIVILSKNDIMTVRHVSKHSGNKTNHLLDDLKTKSFWKHVDVFVLSEHEKSIEIMEGLKPENKTVLHLDLTPRPLDYWPSKQGDNFGLLLNYIKNKKTKHLIKFPRTTNPPVNELIEQIEKFGVGFNFDFDYMLKHKDKSGDSIWAFLLACHGMMSLEYNRNF